MTCNQQLSCSCPSFNLQRWPSILVIFTTSLHSIASASLCLPQSPRPTSYQHCSCLSRFSTCWPFSLVFSPSSSQIYLLLYCLQIQSKNSPFLWCKYIWPLIILSTHFWFDIIMLIFASWNYIIICYAMLCYVMSASCNVTCVQYDCGVLLYFIARTFGIFN